MNKPRILTVEDETVVAEDIRQQLLALGYEPVAETRMGEDAILLTGQLQPDLVLMDIQLAGAMDGIAAAQIIRERFSIPVVFLTALAGDAIINQAKLTEPFGYIIKPFDERELRTNIEMALYKHRAERKLQESEEKFRRTFELMPNFATLRTREGVLLACSDAFCEATGYAREEMLGRTTQELGLWTDLEQLRAMKETLQRDGRVDGLEIQFRRRNGEIRTLQLSARIQALDPEAIVLVVAQDITERRAAEKTLRLHSAALEATANAVVIADRQGIIKWANPAFASLSGWALAEAVGKNPRDLVKSGAHDAAFYRQMWDTLLAGKVWRGEIVNRRKDGVQRTEDMTITPLRDERGEIAHFIAVKQDITDHKTMETHFRQAQRMEAIGTLAGGIAHDLNNILAPILMVTGVLKGKLTDKGDQEIFAMVQSNAQRGAGIIKQLLIFSRGQDGERTVVQPRHFITEMGLMMRETFPREIDVQLQLSAGLWTVIADPTQLHQVLLNLCVNARDAMPTGGRLTVGAANLTLVAGDPKLPPQAKPGPYVVITVGDTGHGIPPEIKHRIFDPFFTTKPLGKGTGLGLSTVLGIVQNHGGWVDLDSTPHEGSTFKVYLPAVPGGLEAATELPAVPATPSPRGQMILVVDDERNVRDMTRLLLERQHYRVLTAVHGADALTQYLRQRTEISLVLTDLMMPVMNGATLIRALRAIEPTLKIIATSGLTEVAEQRELIALGVTDVLLKPCDGPTLLDTVHRQLAGA